jgi:hypothetical protein
MSETRSGVESASVVLISLAVVAGIVELVYKPFLFGPIAFLTMLIGAAISTRYRRLGRIVLFALVFCFMIGASYAVWNSRALY